MTAEITDTGDAPVTKKPARVSAHRAKRPYTRRAPQQAATVEVEVEIDDIAPASIRELKVRKRKGDVDPFYVDPSDIPSGMTYEWKRFSTFGQPDVAHRVHMAENAWEPVQASRHAGKYMPSDYKGPIERDGMTLCERPKYLTREAEQEEYMKAIGQVSDQEIQLGVAPQGTGPRDHEMARPNIKRSHVPVPVTDE